MSPSPDPNGEIVGWRGWVSPGGSVSLYPVRRGDPPEGGPGCCGPLVGVVIAGVVCAAVLQCVVNRPATRRTGHAAMTAELPAAATATRAE